MHTEPAQEKPASALAEIVKLVLTMFSGGLLGNGEGDEMFSLSTVLSPICCTWAARRASVLQVVLCHVTAQLCNEALVQDSEFTGMAGRRSRRRLET